MGASTADDSWELGCPHFGSIQPRVSCSASRPGRFALLAAFTSVSENAVDDEDADDGLDSEQHEAHTRYNEQPQIMLVSVVDGFIDEGARKLFSRTCLYQMH